MVSEEAVLVLGESPFHATHLTSSHQLGYVGGEWERDVAFGGYKVPLAGDIAAGQMLQNVRGVSAERRERLIEVLDIEPSWRLHQVSDGQRRRVQIAMGLLHEFKVGSGVLLLDEITVDLDVLARSSLLDFLKEETETRGCTATHIFDGLDDWPTHVAYLSGGEAKICAPVAEVPSLKDAPRLLEWVEGLLRADAATEPEAKPPVLEADSVTPWSRPWNNGYASGTLHSTIK
ncbi:hypothetical protein QBZ16_005508 [Prototheca wickerhamii]|uniref:ABC transporter domain-containing protein n=1 Tax=Prototheca wickerhamii TaxID=3111 RepID=A0AAD9IEM3_PROWI|nr:hypothetical protein QBZ16_005508 [Prototheca wickerhamii]